MKVGKKHTRMKWVTRRGIHVNRTATAWFVRRFLDPRAEILFVEPEEVAAVQEREQAIGFDAPEATYPHRDDRGRCSFEALVDRINAEVAEVLRAPDVAAHFKEQGADPLILSPEAFLKELGDDVQKWAKVVKSSGARID